MDKTHARLVNWARWARSGRGGAQSCYSAEGRYRPEGLTEEVAEERRSAIPIDIRDALAVWEAIRPDNGFPRRLYLALSAEYIFRLERWRFRGYMRRHGEVLAARSVDDLVAMAVAEAAKRLAT
jgi:hypothetical protein